MQPSFARSARELLGQACDRVGLDAQDARLMRLGSNAVFRLGDPVVVRVTRNDTEVAQARQAIEVARWLESEDYPAVRALRFDQPVMVDGHAVTFWEAVSPVGNEWAGVADIAELLLRLHRLDPPEGLRLPLIAPFGQAEARLAASTWLSDENRRVLSDKLAELQDRYARLDWVLPSGVLHGDASVGNALLHWSGEPVLIDLDACAIGHREWDLILTAVYYDSFGWHTAVEYDTFARVYGYDVMMWSGYSTLREIAEVLMVTWAITKAQESERVALEVSKRIDSLRTSGSRKDWTPLLQAMRLPGMPVHWGTTPTPHRH